MEALWLAGMMWHPAGIAVLVVTVFLSAAVLCFGRRGMSLITPRRLAVGYGGAILVCLAMAAMSSYVSREEAVTTWHVPPEDYWNSVLNEFANAAAVMTYLAVLGIAVVGAPVIFTLARRGFGSIPWALLASVVISLVTMLILIWLSQSSSSRGMRDVLYVTGVHLLVSLAFCLGAGLPWRLKSEPQA